MSQRPRAKLKHLAAKLLAIRQQLGLTQTEIARLLNSKVSYGRVSEFETGVREPNLLVLLRYSEIAGICMCTLIDDKLELPEK
jgi:transcriptional regulator with XRE-family HTH domain